MLIARTQYLMMHETECRDAYGAAILHLAFSAALLPQNRVKATFILPTVALL